MSVIGTRMLRKEDPALLVGEGKYIDDIQVEGQLWMGMVRSTVAHAKIAAVDLSAALEQPGVVGAYTGADLADGYWIAPMPCAWPVTPDMHNPPHHPVAIDTARYVGDIVAVVLADSRYAAADAVEHVVVDYDELPVVATIGDAVADETLVHPDLGTNKCYTWALDPAPDATAAALDTAPHRVSATFKQQRLIPTAMEPRGVLAIPSPHGGDLTLYSSSQIPHILKVMVAATTGIPEHSIRVIAPSVGGGFGAKLNVNADEILAAALATKLGKPVRWTETRTEAAGSTTQGRGQVQHIELGADENGKLTAIRVKLEADMGAYLQLITPGVPLLGGFLYHGVYETPTFSFTCEGYFTNLTPTDAYRGAGRPEACYAIERAMDMLAAEVGVSATEIRRRNYVNGGDAFENWESPAGIVFDSGHYGPSLDAALEAVGYDELLAEQAARRTEGSRTQLGIGICTYVEICGLAPSRVLGSLGFGSGGWEHATVRMLPTGMVEVVSGSAPHGQGHETSWAMIVADKLGIDPAHVTVLHSDTAQSPLGLDTYGSRSLAVGGVAIDMALDKLVLKAKAIVAHQLEASVDDIQLEGGMLSVAGQPDTAVPIQGVGFEAFTAHNLPDGMEPNLQEAVTYDPPNFAFPFGTHVCVVEVDEDTGNTRVRDYVAVDDCGVQINPLIVEGQVHGGVVQGVAQALWEGAVYDDDANLLNPSLLDYLVPSAMEVPNITTSFTVTPSTSNQLGVKGVGEAGTIGSAAAAINAVCDALSENGVTDIEMPATPQRVWRALHAEEIGAAS